MTDVDDLQIRTVGSIGKDIGWYDEAPGAWYETRRAAPWKLGKEATRILDPNQQAPRSSGASLREVGHLAAKPPLSACR
jgi:hypothetical protein